MVDSDAAFEGAAPGARYLMGGRFPEVPQLTGERSLLALWPRWAGARSMRPCCGTDTRSATAGWTTGEAEGDGVGRA